MNMTRGTASIKPAPMFQLEQIPIQEAFRVLGMNPNKFMCSIEALTKRVQKVILRFYVGNLNTIA